MAQMNLPMKHRLRDVENRLVLNKGGGVGEGWSGSVGLSRTSCNMQNGYTGPADSIQCPVINHNGKESEKGCVYTCVAESRCCTTEITTML